MSKMKEVAKILGVEIGEEFEINGYHGSRFRIADEKMEIKSDTDKGLRWIEVAGDSLYELLTGQRKIIKDPWKPKNGEKYWCATYCGASSCEWQGGMSDLAYYAISNCFRTEEEAEAHKEEVLERLEKIYAWGAEEDIAEKKEDGLHSIIRCRQCKYYHEAHYEDPGDPPYIKHQCKNKYGMPKYTVRPDEDYCSRAEKKEEGEG